MQEVVLVPYSVYIINKLAELFPNGFMWVVGGLIVLLIAMLVRSFFPK